ncbi:hypothetical protein RJ639_025092 [Escallonia herrerae]|uniref:Uncharacterized protein n=1 Tax=Escallonia herrerae TaxID=1293975 RepID=A0AA88UY35_9ASTE|nr:hypothetical protein RJ639_025092 [Escallonia herrerae]
MHSKDTTNVFHAVVFFVSKMEGSFADELYAESMKLSNADFSTPLAAGSKPLDSLVSDGDSGELWHEDGSSWNGSVAELNNTSELDREWQRRRNQFHTVSLLVIVMVSWRGKKPLHKRGLILALRNRSLRDSIGVSSEVLQDALKLFHDDLTNKLINTDDNAEVISSIAEPHDESSDGSSLENYYAKLQLLMLQSPGIRMHLKVDG